MKNTNKMPFNEVDGEQNTNTNNARNILVTKRMRDWIAYNYTIDEDIKEELVKERFLNKSLKQLILESPLAWKCGKDKTKIAFDLFTYITVIVIKSLPIIVEIKDSREIAKDATVTDLMVWDYREIDRVENDERYDAVWTLGNASGGLRVSLLQRLFAIGYAYAAKIADYLEANRVITHADSEGSRKILRNKDTFIATLKNAFY